MATVLLAVRLLLIEPKPSSRCRRRANEPIPAGMTGRLSAPGSSPAATSSRSTRAGDLGKPETVYEKDRRAVAAGAGPRGRPSAMHPPAAGPVTPSPAILLSF